MNVLKTSVPKLVSGCTQVIQLRHINKVFYPFSPMNKECFEIFLRRKIVNLTFLTSRVGLYFSNALIGWSSRGVPGGGMENFRGFDRRVHSQGFFFFHARFPVWVKSFIASADHCVLKKTFKKHRFENILLDKS